MGEAAAHNPKAPSTCTQAPCRWAKAMASSNGSYAPLCTLPACRQTMVATSVGPVVERGGESGGHDPTLLVDVDLDRPAGAESEQPQGQVDGVVPFATDQDPYGRAAQQPVRLHVPADPRAARRPGPRPDR